VMANKNLSRTTITAPMDGVITSLKVKRGQKVVGTGQMAGTEMMTVSDIRRMEVRVDVGENDIVKVRNGDSADVQVEAYNNRKFHGVVTQIASSTNKTGAASTTTTDVTSYEVHIRIDPASYRDLLDPANPKQFVFRPGMNASADIKTQRRDNVVSVPIASAVSRIKGSDENIEDKKKERKKNSQGNDDDNAVSGNETETVVFVIKGDGTLEKRVVTTGIQDINYIEITSGLKDGETVVTGPYNAVNKTLKKGDKVTVVAKDKLYDNK
jgi:HlyD family secretion protein